MAKCSKTYSLRAGCVRFIAVALVVGVAASRAEAWNRPGHMVSGAIAYAELQKAHPGALAQVVALFKQHPHYEKKWLPEAQLLPAADRDVYLFMVAARWPDDVREDKVYHPPDRNHWHCIGHPYKPGGQPASVKTHGPDKVNIVSAFALNQGRVRGSAAAKDRAVASSSLDARKEVTRALASL